MHYVSTRGLAPQMTFKDLICGGLASDSGLYVPETYPVFTDKMQKALRGKSYQDIAHLVLGLFAGNSVPSDVLKDIIHKTYNEQAFGSLDIAPVSRLAKDLYILDLARGPTLAFKDIALRLLANLMKWALDETQGCLNVLGSTSGDTGAAANDALADRPGVRSFMISPLHRMSRIQERHMYGNPAENIYNPGIDASFSANEKLVKEVNADREFVDRYHIGAVNSINFIRIIAQVIYYVYARSRVTEHDGQEVTFVVPSGNFGSALAAYIAGQMGPPIRVIVATNENDVIHKFLTTGIYAPISEDRVKVTLSPSMDIGRASNIERLVYDLVGRDPQRVRWLWENISLGSYFGLGQHFPAHYCGISSGSATDEQVIEVIRTVKRHHGIIIDPHTAVAFEVAYRERCRVKGPLVVVSTASPVKFEEAIRKALGEKVPVPPSFQALLDMPQRMKEIEPNAEAIKQFIRDKVPLP